MKLVMIKLTRVEASSLLLAIDAVSDEVGSDKWSQLHDKIAAYIAIYDSNAGGYGIER